ncbi:zinc ABC transporter substrate-binding protein [Aliigemmobacter aestuarii]|uniref:High-affinity zinc uptake system protein ZnuA n=1 Tax=Aliigemmobacter aestuarii TaxID=1445661 RepID=A0A4S3MN58_9RHOB|nr:zinc ABC transporter substrate-binding protein [Gemmobacter aestuarii]THD83434.1 zinc ABC transporter substrate-binding protein [Gemmobacter aestuarii]
MRYIISLFLASTALPAMADAPRVVTDIPPVQSLVAQVMGDLGEPAVLLEKGANAHSFQMRPSQAAELAEADLVVWIGPQLTPWLDRALQGLGEGAERLTLLDAPGTYRQDFADHDAKAEDGGHDHDHDHDHEAETEAAGHSDGGHFDEGHEDGGHEDEGHEDGGHEDHAHSGLDPHAWLDPANGRVWLDVIAAELGRIDPDNAAAYQANAEAARARITALDGELSAILGPVRDRPFMVEHDAYGYFAGHYGLSVKGSVRLGDATEPGAAHLADLRSGLEGVVCVFPEAGHDPKSTALLIEGTDVRLGSALDPEGSMIDPGPDAYETLLRALAGTLTDCLAP